MIQLGRAGWRAVALALLAVPLLALLGGAFLADALAARHAQLAEKVGLLARLATTRDQLVAERQALMNGDEGSALAGRSPALAGAALQRDVDRVIGESGGRVESLLVLPPVDETAYQRIGLRATFTARIGPLRGILHGLEAGPPAMFVQALSVRDQSEQAGEDPELSIALEVYGFVKRPAPGS